MSSVHVVNRSAPTGNQGTWEIKHKYRCTACGVKTDTLDALSPAHDKVTCDIEGCTITTPYRACDTAAAAKHAYCKGCKQYKCNGKTHVKVLCPDTFLDRYGSSVSVDSCGQEYWKCVSGVLEDHGVGGYCNGCRKFYKSCVASKHALQASCSETDINGNTCTVTGFYPCVPHTHQYSSGSGSQPGNGNPTLVQCDRFGCTEMVPTRRHHRKQCGTQDGTSAPGCGVWIWTCKSSNSRHIAHRCSKQVFEDDGSKHRCTHYVRQCTPYSGKHTISKSTAHVNNQNKP